MVPTGQGVLGMASGRGLPRSWNGLGISARPAAAADVQIFSGRAVNVPVGVGVSISGLPKPGDQVGQPGNCRRSVTSRTLCSGCGTVYGSSRQSSIEIPRVCLAMKRPYSFRESARFLRSRQPQLSGQSGSTQLWVSGSQRNVPDLGKPIYAPESRGLRQWQAETSTGQPSSLVSVFTSALACVISLEIARALWMLKLWPKTVAGMALSAIIAASLPLLAEAIALTAAPSIALHSGKAIAWIIALSILDTVGFLSAWFCMTLWVRAAPSVASLVAGCAGLDATLAWYSRTLSRRRQVIVSLTFTAIACTYVRLVQPVIATRIEISPISYVAVAWTAIIGSNMVYWLIINPEMIRRLLRLKGLNMIWHSPARTDAIERLSTGFAVTTVAWLAAALTTEFLAFQINHYGKSALLLSSTIIVPVVAGLLALVVGLMPHWSLYVVVRDARRRSLEFLSRAAGRRPPTSRDSIARVEGVIQLYRLVEGSPGLPFSNAMVPYASAIVGSMAAYLLSLAHLH
jgi:hypothetical protein